MTYPSAAHPRPKPPCFGLWQFVELRSPNTPNPAGRGPRANPSAHHGGDASAPSLRVLSSKRDKSTRAKLPLWLVARFAIDSATRSSRSPSLWELSWRRVSLTSATRHDASGEIGPVQYSTGAAAGISRRKGASPPGPSQHLWRPRLAIFANMERRAGMASASGAALRCAIGVLVLACAVTGAERHVIFLDLLHPPPRHSFPGSHRHRATHG